MDSWVIDRCWKEAASFHSFEERLGQSKPMDLAAWRQVAAFLYQQARHKDWLCQKENELGCNHKALCKPERVFHSPEHRPKFTRGTLEGEIIHAISPGSTPKTNGCIFTPLDSSMNTTPALTPATSRMTERRPLVSVVLLPSQEASDQPSPPQSPSSDQPENTPLLLELFAGQDPPLVQVESPLLVAECGGNLADQSHEHTSGTQVKSITASVSTEKLGILGKRAERTSVSFSPQPPSHTSGIGSPPVSNASCMLRTTVKGPGLLASNSVHSAAPRYSSPPQVQLSYRGTPQVPAAGGGISTATAAIVKSAGVVAQRVFVPVIVRSSQERIVRVSSPRF